jgi:hypothetical protein
MFAAILDDQAIINDPTNEDILDDLLKYCDMFAEDEVLAQKRGPSIFTVPPRELCIGRLKPTNGKVANYAPLENDGKPLLTLLQLQPLDGKKGDFGRKVLNDSVPEPEVAKKMLDFDALRILDAARKSIAAMDGPDDAKKAEMDAIIDDTERILLKYVPDTK